MKLKIKNLNWLTGKLIVVIHPEAAKVMNVFQGDRVAIQNKRKHYATVDISTEIIKKGEVGFSKELTKIFGFKNGKVVEVSAGLMSPASQLISKKIDGHRLTEKEIGIIIDQIVKNNLTEAEVAFFIAAEKLVGLNKYETISLIRAMVKTGLSLNFGKSKKIADKHCIGGVAGNRTTPIVVSICAAAGLTVPKTSSRAITSAAGTADVIETISNVEFKLKDLKQIVSKTGAALSWGGSLNLSPSDDKIIQVERLLNLDVPGQMIASILSKKIAAGSKYVLIDIPYGKGSKVQTLKKAKVLGKSFIEYAKPFGIKLSVVYTDGKQPVGHGIGPVLEMLDVLKVLENTPDAPRDLRKKALYLSTELMRLSGVKNPKKKAKELLETGAAFEKFKEIINAQNNNKLFEKKVGELMVGKYSRSVTSPKTGNIVEIDNNGINNICRILGTPETKSAGVYLHKGLGRVKKGEEFMTLYSENQKKLDEAVRYLQKEGPILIK